MSLLTNKYKNLTFKITRDREENTPHLRKLEDSSLQGFKEFFKHLKIRRFEDSKIKHLKIKFKAFSI